MSTLTANSCNVIYTVTTTDNDVTVRLTNITRSGYFSQTTNRTVSLKLGGTTLLTRTARKPPTRTQIASTKDHKGKITATMMTSILSEEKTSESANIDKAWSDFLSDFNTKKNANALTITYARGTADKQYNLVFTVFGISASVTIVVAEKGGGSSTPTTHEVNKIIGIEKVNNGKNYVINAAAYAKYGHIERVVDFSDVKDEKQLLSLATTYANSMQFDDMSLSVSAVDLHNLTGSIPAFELLDEVRCISDPHGLDRTFPITEITIPLDDPSGVQYTLGKTGVSSMSQSTASNAADLFKKINQQPAPTTILDAAKIQMSEILNSRTTGYVNIVQENDISQALVISNAPDWTQATKLWKFDINGLGYSDDTITAGAADVYADGRFYKLGLTMDGTIVADFIKTGILEDGVGKNYWNMSTGDFSLSSNTEFYSSNENDPSVTTIEELTQSVADNEKQSKSNGNTNLLKGTSAIVLNRGTYETKSFKSGNASKVTVMNILDSIPGYSPNEVLLKSVKILSSRATKNGWIGDVFQYNIPISKNTTYITGCYVAGTGPVAVQIYCIDGNNVEHYRRYSEFVSSSDWTRINLVFKTSNDPEPSESSLVNDINTKRNLMNTRLAAYNNAKGAHGANSTEARQARTSYMEAKRQYNAALNNKTIYDSTLYLNGATKIRVIYGIYAFANNHRNTAYTVDFTGFFLSRGNAYEDWQPGYSEIIDRSKEDTSAILTQAEILKRLRTKPDGSVCDGIFMKNGNLYIGAKYIDATAQTTKILTSNYIQDSANKNYWNLTDGTLRTNSMIANQATVYGTLSGGSWSRPSGNKSNKNAKFTGATVSGTSIYFKSIKYKSNGALEYNFNTSIIRGSSIDGKSGLNLCSRGSLSIFAPKINVVRPRLRKAKPVNASDKTYWAEIETGQTLSLTIYGYYKDSRTKKMVYGKRLRLYFINGILTKCQRYDSSSILINRDPYKDPYSVPSNNRYRRQYIKDYEDAIMTTYIYGGSVPG